MSPKSKPWSACAALASIAVAAALAGCACESAQCGVDPDNPPFGEGTKKLFRDISEIPDVIAEDVSHRSDLLAEYRRDWFANRCTEVHRTRDHLAAVGPGLRDEFTVRGAQAMDFFSRQGERANTDACCFFTRAWHSIKQAGRF